ncbi:MAG: DUF1638 domain-containing protein [Peptostreptococcaceae bacterium]
MSTKIIACSNLKEEINFVCNKLNIKIDVIWVDSKYHNNPKILNQQLQNNIDLIDEIGNIENVLLLYGSCGNAIEGLKSKKSNIVYIKVDDCFTLFLGGRDARKKDYRSYYFTKTHLENEKSLWNEFCMCEKKHGNVKTKKIYKIMLKDYESIKVIDTGAYDVESILDRTKQLAETFNLKHKIVKGNLSIIEKALCESWDEDFIINKKGNKIQLLCYD